jgi:hypothetical protein
MGGMESNSNFFPLSISRIDNQQTTDALNLDPKTPPKFPLTRCVVDYQRNLPYVSKALVLIYVIL